MVVAELSGGLGNQMFQYAYAMGAGERVRADASKMAAYPGVPRKFGLWHFGIRDRGADADRDRYVAVGADGYETVDVGEGDDMRVRGLWMGEGPWAHVADRVRALFALGGDPIEAIAVHVRRADFLSPDSPMVNLGMDYYLSALMRLPMIPVKVFSDDPAFARENFGAATVVDEPDQFRALALMSRCRHHVIANSSFSWWAAWLGEKGTIVAPSQWLKRCPAAIKQIVPERWRTV